MAIQDLENLANEESEKNKRLKELSKTDKEKLQKQIEKYTESEKIFQSELAKAIREINKAVGDNYKITHNDRKKNSYMLTIQTGVLKTCDLTFETQVLSEDVNINSVLVAERNVKIAFNKRKGHQTTIKMSEFTLDTFTKSLAEHIKIY